MDSNENAPVEETAQRLPKGSKKMWIIAGSVALALILCVIILVKIQTAAKDITKDVEITFSGYDGSGTATYNVDEIDMLIRKICAKKSDPLSASLYMDDVQCSLDPTEDLSNGDTITFEVITTLKDSPIKSVVKEFTVKGLEEPETIESASLLKEHPVKFIGANGYGKILLNDSEEESIFEMSGDQKGKNLKNGDEITLTVSEEYQNTLEEEGKVLDSDTIQVTVAGLPELTEMPDIKTLLAANDDLVKSKYENTTYTSYAIESVENYMKYDYTGTSWTESVYGGVSLVGIYKITKSGDFVYSDNVVYVAVGYKANMLSDQSLDLDTKTENNYSPYGTTDLENLRSSLRKDGYKVLEIS